MKTRCSHCGLNRVWMVFTHGHFDPPTAGDTYVSDADPCLAPLLRALNDAGIPTIEHCCGHGERTSRIWLQDGRVLTLEMPQEAK